ncbi:hypothetical protein OF897_21240 [Chryseobacterium formosus]|uniref:Uncharacterized protein n=1 Tax=Chryseobacterium formosus TaxID=1537363 RepID=A0ABT3XXT2_9FLAO|nr:hypothetical protein [Chryseobacterium formosus]MCX8526446.1 hypothetical protein [Chryseobacterium formosus]
MDIEDKYHIVHAQNSISFMPNLPSKKLSVIVFWISVIMMASLFFLLENLSFGAMVTLIILVGYVIIHSLYDIFFRSQIKITVDEEKKAIYRSNFFKETEIIQNKSTVVFIKKNMGAWHYAIGPKKKYLYQNYRISEDFYNRKKDNKSQKEYEQKILKRIIELLNS